MSGRSLIVPQDGPQGFMQKKLVRGVVGLSCIVICGVVVGLAAPEHSNDPKPWYAAVRAPNAAAVALAVAHSPSTPLRVSMRQVVAWVLTVCACVHVRHCQEHHLGGDWVDLLFRMERVLLSTRWRSAPSLQRCAVLYRATAASLCVDLTGAALVWAPAQCT